MVIITIGRNPENKVMIHDHTLSVSGNHGELKIADDGAITYNDVSRHGTVVNGKKIHNQSVPVQHGTAIIFPNGSRLDWNQVPAFSPLPNVKKQLSIGKSADNDIKLNASAISRYHALLKITYPGQYYLFDQSLNGITVNGTKIPKFTNVEVKRGDKVFFANAEGLNWSEVPNSRVVNKYAIIIPLLAIVLSVAAYFLYPFIFKNSVYSQYQNSVGLIYNSYYLAYVDKGDTLYYIGANGIVDLRADPFGRDTLKPYSTISGSGFYVTNDGKIITNKHVAVPWESDLDTDRDKIEQAINYLRLKTKYEISSGVKIVGVYDKLGIIPNNSPLDRNDTLKYMLPCKFIRSAPEKEVDLAVIQLESGKIPAGCIPVTNIIATKDELKEDQEVTAIGYPFGMDLALKNTENKFKATSNHGKVSKISDQYEVQYDMPSFHGASGSPVFNQDGMLVAVNYLGNERVSGYNFGIIATNIKKLLEP